MSPRILLFCLVASGTSCLHAAGEKSVISPPAQPADGPGGSLYRHAAVRQTTHGTGGSQYHLFEPDQPAATEKTPVIVFLHGWTAIDPWLYGAWIEHLTRRGNVVIHARYQETALTPNQQFTPNTVAAVKAAFTELNQPGHTPIDPERFAIAGHSVGGLLTVNLAVLAEASGLPRPRALMSVQPGRSARAGGGFGIRMEDLSKLPGDALLLCVTGEKDTVCGDSDARRILRESVSIPSERKNLVIQTADDHGFPPLTASHLAPCSPPADPPGIPETSGEPSDPDFAAIAAAMAGDFGPVRKFLATPQGRLWRKEKLAATAFAETFDAPNAQDFALWRLFDSLCDAAFTGKITVDAIGKSPRSLTMGNWSDGRPVNPMKTANP